MLAPEDEEIIELTTVVATRIQSLVDRRGLGADNSEEDALSRDQPGLAALYASSVRSRIAVGSNTGQRVTKFGDQIDGDSLDTLQSPRCATVAGFSVHANVSIEARDRMRLERLPLIPTIRLRSREDTARGGRPDVQFRDLWMRREKTVPTFVSDRDSIRSQRQ